MIPDDPNEQFRWWMSVPYFVLAHAVPFGEFRMRAAELGMCVAVFTTDQYEVFDKFQMEEAG